MARFVEIAGSMVDVERVVAFRFPPAGREGKYMVELTMDTPPHEAKTGSASLGQWPQLCLGPICEDQILPVTRNIAPPGQVTLL